MLETTCVMMLGLLCSSVGDAPELVTNAGFGTPDSQGIPEGWSVWLPEWSEAACTFRATEQGLRVESPDTPFAVGGVAQEIQGIEGGSAYLIRVTCQLHDVQSPLHSLLVRLTWLADGRPLHPAGVLMEGPVVNERAATFEDVLVAPADADSARLSLETKWLGDGAVTWREASLRACEPPERRTARVGTVFLRPSQSTPEQNLKLFCDQIDAAGKLGLDIVCLGEAITTVGTRAGLRDVAQPIPGHDTEILGAAARRNHIWVVAGLTELDADTIYNTAVLFDRQGQVAGKYRKVHLPREEWRKGITPGHEYPVFETDFGTVAIQICYDWFFPEPEALFAMQGAEIIFAPTWGNTLPDEGGRVDGETTFRVRARDNGVYMVPSVYDGNSMVIDPMGRILASNNGETGVFWAEIELGSREALRWVGHWRSIGPRHRMPSTYGDLVK